MSLIIALGILLPPLAAGAEQPGKVWRIGYMSIPSRQSAADSIDHVFLPELRERGLVEGKNLIIEWRWAEGKVERLPEFAAELVRLNVDLIVAPQTASALAAKNATRTIPIVFMFPGDPVGVGLVASLARPGGNATGLTGTPTPEIYGKQLELLKETVPKASRVAVLSNPASAAVMAPVLREVERAARSLGLELQVLGVQGPEDFDRAFEAMTRKQADALFVLPVSMFFLHRQRLAHLAATHRLPSMDSRREFVESGGLMAYGVNLAWHMRRAAFYIDRILKGANPANLPVEQPTKFDLVINLKTAKALGLTIPQSVLIRADEVIQ
jgi:putative ABC transport system substrate-binding protein